jgi:alkylated DNA repair protein (DNA oxidative demethylase)
MDVNGKTTKDLIIRPGYWPRERQELAVTLASDVIRQAPLFTPRMPRTGKPFSVQMTNCGRLGWVSDLRGYRYQPTHPATGQPWPPIPQLFLDAWLDLARYSHPPEACLINVYRPGAKMGLHQDRDEDDFEAPVLSLSLGDTCIFRIGGNHRDEATKSVRLASGDAVVLGGAFRLAFHGVEKIIPGSSTILSDGGRINLTLRRVSKPGSSGGAQ